MHNILLIDACLLGISHESEGILADVHTLNIHCCYAKYYEGEEFFSYNIYIEKVNIDFFIVMYVVLSTVCMETVVFWDMTPCSPLMSTDCCLHQDRR
jgi:hypothetical protein